MRSACEPWATTTRQAARRISSMRPLAGCTAACSVPGMPGILTDKTVRRQAALQIPEGTIAIAPIEHRLEEGWTLPASWYSDPNVNALERDRIFASAWQYAGP